MSVSNLSAKEAFSLLESNKNAVLVDVRTYEEFNNVGVVDDIDFVTKAILLPWKLISGVVMVENVNFYEELNSQLLDIFQSDRFNAQLLFMCKSGVRSMAAAQHLTKHNYTNCYNIIDGFEGPSGWKSQLLPWKISEKLFKRE